tara:strand:- start:447 stop:1478 length:1032 start_codon:yes stop_codon:yes gene_type:complete
MTWYEGFEKGQWKALNKPNPKVVQDKKDAKHGDLWPDPNTNCLYMNMGHKWMCVNDPNDKKKQNQIEKRIKDINERYKYEQWQKGYSFGKKNNIENEYTYNDFMQKIRRYESPDGYFSWVQLIKSIYLPSIRSQTPKPFINALNSFAPAIYLTEELYNDFLLTDIPKNIQIPKLVLPSFWLFTPYDYKSYLVTQDQSIYINYMKIENKGKLKYFREVKVDVSNVDNNDIKQKIIMNSLLYMTTVKEVLEIENNDILDIQQKPYMSEESTEYKPVTWLGSDYTRRIVYLNKNDNDPIEIAKRRSPRPHWRKGHWHTVLQAPGRKQKRLKWFRPCFVQPKQLQEV